FFADFFAAFFADFLAAFFVAFFAVFFFAATAFLAFLLFFFFAFAIVILLLPAEQWSIGPSVVHLRSRCQSASSTPAASRPSPNREAQSCARPALRRRWQSAPCSRYCPQQSCPA